MLSNIFIWWYNKRTAFYILIFIKAIYVCVFKKKIKQYRRILKHKAAVSSPTYPTSHTTSYFCLFLILAMVP